MKNGDRDESVWSVLAGGKGLAQVGSYEDHDGKRYPIHNTYKRITGDSGLVGKWELTDSVNPPGAYRYLEFRSWEGDGLSILDSFGKVMQNMKFDGKDYPDLTTPKAVSFGSRPNRNTLKTTDKFDGKVSDTSELKSSADGRTVTVTTRDPEGRISSVVVYNKVNSFPNN